MTEITTPAVSIVIPAYNRADTIRMAVESVLRQTFTDFELLIVDDGSTDGTMAALADLPDPRLRLLANPRNMGAGAARNLGIREARAPWVAFHDSDDEWLPRKLEKQMKRLSTVDKATVACFCGMVLMMGANWQAGDLALQRGKRAYMLYIPASSQEGLEGDIRPSLLRSSPVSTQMLVARRDTLQQIGGFDESLPALIDWDCTIRLAERGHFAFVDEPLVLQFLSDNSISHSRAKRVAARIRILEKHHTFFAGHRKILAAHHVSIAGDLRQMGDLRQARSFLMTALRIYPFAAKTWAKWLWVAGLAAWSSRTP